MAANNNLIDNLTDPTAASARDPGNPVDVARNEAGLQPTVPHDYSGPNGKDLAAPQEPHVGFGNSVDAALNALGLMSAKTRDEREQARAQAEQDYQDEMARRNAADAAQIQRTAMQRVNRPSIPSYADPHDFSDYPAQVLNLPQRGTSESEQPTVDTSEPKPKQNSRINQGNNSQSKPTEQLGETQLGNDNLVSAGIIPPLQKSDSSKEDSNTSNGTNTTSSQAPARQGLPINMEPGPGQRPLTRADVLGDNWLAQQMGFKSNAAAENALQQEKLYQAQQTPEYQNALRRNVQQLGPIAGQAATNASLAASNPWLVQGYNVDQSAKDKKVADQRINQDLGIGAVTNDPGFAGPSVGSGLGSFTGLQNIGTDDSGHAQLQGANGQTYVFPDSRPGDVSSAVASALGTGGTGQRERADKAAQQILRERLKNIRNANRGSRGQLTENQKLNALKNADPELYRRVVKKLFGDAGQSESSDGQQSD